MGNIKKRIAACTIGALVISAAFQTSVFAAEKKINLDCVKGFNCFVLDDFTCNSMHTEGKLAAGGKITSTTLLSICTHDDVNEPTLVIGKGIDANQVDDKYGYGVVQNSCKDENIKINTYTIGNDAHSKDTKPVRQEVFDFESVRTTLKEESKELAETKSNEEVVKKDGRMLLKSDKTDGTAVFSITAQDIKDVNQQIDIDVDKNVVAVINVKGDVVDIPCNGQIVSKGQTHDDGYFGNILWNFSDTAKINLGLTFDGTILAPNADITIISGGNIEGQLIAKSYTQPEEHKYEVYETHLNPFDKNITVEVPDEEVSGGNNKPSQSGETTKPSTGTETEKPSTKPSTGTETEKPNKTENPETDESTGGNKNPLENAGIDNTNKKPEAGKDNNEKPAQDAAKKDDTKPVQDTAKKDDIKQPLQQTANTVKNAVQSSAYKSAGSRSAVVKTADTNFSSIIMLTLLSGMMAAYIKLKSIKSYVKNK